MNDRQFQQFLCVLISCLLIASCGMVYKQTVTQGTLFDPDSVDQLEVGMNKEQVQFLIGRPILDDPFLKDQWKYIHLTQRADVKPVKLELTLHFKDNLLTNISGDFEKIVKRKSKTKNK